MAQVAAACRIKVKNFTFLFTESYKERVMSYLGEEIGKLGFGLMRLPKTDDVIDIEQVKKWLMFF